MVRISFWDYLRSNLDQDDVIQRLDRMEQIMATAQEQLTTLTGKVDDVMADVRAALETLRAERGNLTPEAQSTLDALSAKVAAFDAEIGDADGSDTPPVQPAPDEPVA